MSVEYDWWAEWCEARRRLDRARGHACRTTEYDATEVQLHAGTYPPLTQGIDTDDRPAV